MFNWRAAARTKHLPTVIGLLTGTLCGTALIRNKEVKSSTLKNRLQNTGEEQHPKVFTSKEVAAHDCLKNGVWVTYQGKVYDITEFINSHPGGQDKILMSGGGALEPYWSVYPVHKNNTILDILEQYCIGRLDQDDREKTSEETFDDPYLSDPKRHPASIVRVQKPFIAEVPIDLLMDHYITPNELHYVRNHMPVPAINEKDYRLTLSGKGVRDVRLSLKDLKQKFKKHTLVATLQCAGNRARQVQKKPLTEYLGGPGPGLISTAEWSGVLLKDVLEYAGLDDEVIESLGIEHIEFEGLDYDVTETSYGVSIPISKVMDRKGDVLLAYEMNGEDLPPDHGYPIRVLVPGVAACRSVKWLGNIIVSNKESDSFWQQNKYKVSPSKSDCTSTSISPSIQEFPVTSAICYPKDNHTFSRQNHDSIPIKGYACSGGGRSIIRVDVSIDGGKTWTTANLKRREQPTGRQWAWTFWECEVSIPVGVDRMEIVCRAVDNSYNVQPERDILNSYVYLKTSWGRVNVEVED